MQDSCNYCASSVQHFSCKTCRIRARIPESARDMSVFLHISCTICKHLARQIVQELASNVLPDFCQQDYTLQDEECKFLARKMYISCTLLARNVYPYFHFLQGTMLKLHVSSKHIARFLHVSCTKYVTFLARNHAQIARFLQAYCTFLARIASSKIIIINTEINKIILRQNQ